MKEITLSKKFALIALNGITSSHPSTAKDTAVRGISAAKVLEDVLAKETIEENEWKEKLEEVVKTAKTLKKQEANQLEQAYRESLMTENLLEVVPDILGCDMTYTTAGIELEAYRSDERAYLSIREEMRAEVLEEGEITLESMVLLWLNRESGCIHDLFSVEEQKKVQQRMVEQSAKNPIYRTLWEAEYHHVFEKFVQRFLKAKSNLFKNPYLEGVNVVFPFIERRKAIFIDTIVFGSSVGSRRLETMEYLSQKGHYVEEVKNGTETLLKIDDFYYRIVPGTRRCQVPIQGVNLIPVYWM